MPPELPFPPQDLVVHVGTGKTGTSSIQAFLRENRSRLADLGVLVPRSPGPARHIRFGLSLRPDEDMVASGEWKREGGTDPATFRRRVRRRLFSEIADGGLDRLLLSDESLFGATRATLQNLGAFTRRVSRTTRLVAYLRRQDAHLVSRYQQRVKVGETALLRDWVDQDSHRFYDYYARLRRHQELVGPTEIVVRRFEPAGFVNASLIDDFLDAVGMAPDPGFVAVPRQNESLDADSVEFLRLLALHKIENEHLPPPHVDNRKLTTRLAGSEHGPVLSLPHDRLDAFAAQWRESNERVVREFLHEPDGPLFHTSRSGADVRTDQRLDPSRLEHLFEVSGLPEHIHQPLRVIAEREARRP